MRLDDTQFIIVCLGIMIILVSSVVDCVDNVRLKKENDTYERYYNATESMLDIMPEPVVDSATCTMEGFRYLDEKEKVDSLCHIRPKNKND